MCTRSRATCSAALASPHLPTRLAGVRDGWNCSIEASLTLLDPQWRLPSSNGRGAPLPHPHRSQDLRRSARLEERVDTRERDGMS